MILTLIFMVVTGFTMPRSDAGVEYVQGGDNNIAPFMQPAPRYHLNGVALTPQNATADLQSNVGSEIQ